MMRPSARPPSLIALDADDDAVAVHRFVQMRAGDVDVAAAVSSGRSGVTKP